MPANSIIKPCHNCRRRRLRCDRSWPSCYKCAFSGQECLGYGKVFVWTQAINSDGNSRPPSLSGRRRSESDQYQPQQVLECRPPHTLRGEARPRVPSPAAWGPDALCDSPDQARTHQSILQICSHGRRPEGEPSRAELGHQRRLRFRGWKLSHASSAPDRNKPDRGGDQVSSHQLSQPDQRLDKPNLSTCGTLIDPVFQDLDRNSRYYLAHFADSVCKDLVARDTPRGNPFRELIPLTNKYPLLLQIIIATSAVHWSNLFRPVTAFIPTGSTDPGGYLVQIRSHDFVSSQALIDALTAKQKAMGHLRAVLDTLDPAGGEVTLAAMHFFIKFDLIDLDRNHATAWQEHMKGTSSILALLVPESPRHVSSRMLRDCVIADCFIYHILGSTLASRPIASRIARYAFELLPVIKRVEVNSYLSCPPEILQIILLASQLSYETHGAEGRLPVATEALALIDKALAFDITAWADRLRAIPNVSDMESRIHIASAHRSAACLYILQALPLVRDFRPLDNLFLVVDILSHLGQIGEDDPYFKATSWPMLMAGAETRDAKTRDWIMSRMFSIWKTCPWGYIFTVVEILRATWQMQDSATGSDVNWLQHVKKEGLEYLIV